MLVNKDTPMTNDFWKSFDALYSTFQHSFEGFEALKAAGNEKIPVLVSKLSYFGRMKGILQQI